MYLYHHHPAGHWCGLALIALAGTAQAHVVYSGRDILVDGAFDGNSYYLESRVTGNYGWADGVDADWGDSHRVRFMTFTLDQGANVNISVFAIDNGIHAADLNPGFSIYTGKVPHLSHDGSDHPDFLANHPGMYPTVNYYDGVNAGPAVGAFRSRNDFTMGNASHEVPAADWSAATLDFLYAANELDVDFNGDGIVDILGDGDIDNDVSWGGLLGPGTYSLIVGGTCYSCQFDGVDPLGANVARGFAVDMEVAPVPVPAAAWLFGSALAGLFAVARRRRV